MRDAFLQFVLYFGRLLLLTLGTVVICGLSVRLCACIFSRLLGNGAARIFDATAAIGTPIHELGHALMCPLFFHKITKVRLWSPTAQGGVYGFVEHRYSKKNPWASLGNLFIGIGPIFSGLGVVVLTLRLCFPNTWSEYLVATRTFLETGGDAETLFASLSGLLASTVLAVGDVWWRGLVGIAVILSVALHISLSWVDIKSSLNALPIYLCITAVFGAVTAVMGIDASVIDALRLFHLRLLSLFCIVIAFSAVWVALALLYRVCRTLRRWF